MGSLLILVAILVALWLKYKPVRNGSESGFSTFRKVKPSGNVGADFVAWVFEVWSHTLRFQRHIESRFDFIETAGYVLDAAGDAFGATPNRLKFCLIVCGYTWAYLNGHIYSFSLFVATAYCLRPAATRFMRLLELNGALAQFRHHFTRAATRRYTNEIDDANRDALDNFREILFTPVLQSGGKTERNRKLIALTTIFIVTPALFMNGNNPTKILIALLQLVIRSEDLEQLLGDYSEYFMFISALCGGLSAALGTSSFKEFCRESVKLCFGVRATEYFDAVYDRIERYFRKYAAPIWGAVFGASLAAWFYKRNTATKIAVGASAGLAAGSMKSNTKNEVKFTYGGVEGGVSPARDPKNKAGLGFTNGDANAKPKEEVVYGPAPAPTVVEPAKEQSVLEVPIFFGQPNVERGLKMDHQLSFQPILKNFLTGLSKLFRAPTVLKADADTDIVVNDKIVQFALESKKKKKSNMLWVYDNDDGTKTLVFYDAGTGLHYSYNASDDLKLKYMAFDYHDIDYDEFDDRVAKSRRAKWSDEDEQFHEYESSVIAGSLRPEVVEAITGLQSRPSEEVVRLGRALKQLKKLGRAYSKAGIENCVLLQQISRELIDGILRKETARQIRDRLAKLGVPEAAEVLGEETKLESLGALPLDKISLVKVMTSSGSVTGHVKRDKIVYPAHVHSMRVHNPTEKLPEGEVTIRLAKLPGTTVQAANPTLVGYDCAELAKPQVAGLTSTSLDYWRQDSVSPSDTVMYLNCADDGTVCAEPVTRCRVYEVDDQKWGKLRYLEHSLDTRAGDCGGLFLLRNNGKWYLLASHMIRRGDHCDAVLFSSVMATKSLLNAEGVKAATPVKAQAAGLQSATGGAGAQPEAPKSALKRVSFAPTPSPTGAPRVQRQSDRQRAGSNNNWNQQWGQQAQHQHGYVQGPPMGGYYNTPPQYNMCQGPSQWWHHPGFIQPGWNHMQGFGTMGGLPAQRRPATD